MIRINICKRALLSSLFLLFSSLSYSLPFNIYPKNPLPKNVAQGGTVIAYYTVANMTGTLRKNNHVKYLPDNVVQITKGGTYPDTCGTFFNLSAKNQKGSSCTLQLKISGAVNAADPNPQKHLFVCFPGDKTCAGPIQPLNVKTSSKSIAFYQNWINQLGKSGISAKEGNAFLLTNADCPFFVSIFDSCFGQNPAAPYIIPQPPIENSYVDPYYGTALNTPGPDGTTNILYRLANNQALVTILSYPPTAAYLGYQSYVFTSQTSNYTGITPPRSRTVSPDPSRYEIVGSIGNDLNNIIVQNQYVSPWNGTIVMYITTSNKALAESLKLNAQQYGINEDSIFIEPIGSNVIMGNSATADDMITLIRYALPESSSQSNTWINNLSAHVLVYKITKPIMATMRYGTNSYTAHSINNSELSLSTAQQQLATLLKVYLQNNKLLPASYAHSIITSKVTAQGVPQSGLVGSYCIYYGTNCEADNQDTSTYSYFLLHDLGADDVAFIAGINHSLKNNNRYVSVDIYNAATSSGVASSSQTNVRATGFESGNLDGSAQQVLQSLGIAIPPNYTELAANINYLYVSFIARNCNLPYIVAANDYCINLDGNNLIPLIDPISITERSYILPGTTTGGNPDYMLYPMIIALNRNIN